MKLQRDSLLVRFAYTLPWPWHYITMDPLWIPSQTTVCSFFWRVVLRVPFWIVAALALPSVGVIALMVSIIAACSFVGTSVISRDFRRTASEFIKAKKERFCPIVHIN